MARLLRNVAFGVSLVGLMLAALELASLLLLEGFDTWPTRAEVQATLVAPEMEAHELRVHDPELPMLRDFVLHPYMGFVRNNARARHVLNRNVIDLPVNELGFIGPLPPRSASKDRVVIGITGGSVASELFLFSRDVLRDALASSPAFADRDIEIVSFALAGMKQPQQLMALAWLLTLGHHFNVVINLDGFNEVALPLGENVPAGVSPSYPRNWRGYAARALDAETLWHAGRLEVAKHDIERWRSRFSQTPWRHSSLALLLWHQRLTAHEAQHAEVELALRRRLETPATLDAQTRGPKLADTAREAIVADSVAVWQAASRQLAALCEAQGIEYWHFLQPNLFFPDTKPLDPWEAAVVIDAERWSFGPGAVQGHAPLQAAGTELRAAGVRFVDLSSAFRTTSERIYRDVCCHYDEHGYEMLAKDIARHIAPPDAAEDLATH